MIRLACPRCGASSRAGARFCGVCGAIMAQGSVRAPAYTTGVARPASPIERSGMRRVVLGLRDGIPLVGLLFGALFLIAVAQVLANHGLRMFGTWPVGLLVGGALLAEQAWVNGNLWGGLRGMLLWGGLTGLLALGLVFPWGLLLIPIWLMLWLHAHGRRA